MINIILQISIYILMAIVLGYFFGWLITKILLKQKYTNQLDEVSSIESIDKEELNTLKDELSKYKKANKLLRIEGKKATSGYQGQKYVLDEHNEVLDEFQKRLLRKDEVIETLTHKLSSTEEKLIKVEKKYEEEIDAFMFERIEITKRYKDLLNNKNISKKSTVLSSTKETWFSKLFSFPSATIY